ncbi:MAG: hypothetical protein ACPGAK_02205, partial [Bacteroidia bacterium]
MSPEDIVHWAQSQSNLIKQKVTVLLADINNVSGVSNFLREAKKHPGVRPLVGVEVRNGDEALYVLVSTSQKGFAAINRFISEHQLAAQPYPVHPPKLEESFCIYPFYKVSALKPK